MPSRARRAAGRPANAADPALAALLESSRAGAEQVGEGGFRLDWSRALDKVKRFQLSDPHRYVLELVQAAVAAGATAIGVETDADDVILRFDGRPFARMELERLFDHLFGQSRERTHLRQLALGVNASLALKPKFVVVDSGDGREGARLRLTSHTDLSLTPLPAEERLDGTRIHVRDRVSWRTLVDAVRKSPAEAQLLAEGCRFAPLPVRLNGKLLRQPFEPDALARHAFEQAGIRGEVVLPAAPLPRSRVTLCMNGVVVCTLELEEKAGTIAACLDNPALTRNASHSDVVKDAELTRTMRFLGREIQRLLLAWLKERFAHGGWSGEPGEVDRYYLRLAAYALLRANRKTAIPPELERLLDAPGVVDLPLYPARTSTLRPFWTAFQETGTCRTSYRRVELEALPPDRLAAFGPRPMLEAIFGGKLSDASEELSTLEAASANRRRLEAQRQAPVLPPRATLLKVPLARTDPPLAGELGLRAETGGSEAVEVMVLRDGVPLERRPLTLGALSALAVVDSPAFEPNLAWDGLRQECSAWEAVPAMLLGAMPALLRALHDAFPLPPPPAALTRMPPWRPAGGEGSFHPGWARDPQSAVARQHLDDLLELGPRLASEVAPWLWSWPIWSTIEGTPVSLERIAEGKERVPYVVTEPWGPSGLDGIVLNLTEKQLKVLHHYLGPRLRSVARELASKRRILEVRAEVERKRAENRARAEQRRQEPRLDRERFLAVVDLPSGIGVGQVGIPVATRESFVRFLCEGLPVCEQELQVKAFPLQAVLEAKGVSPNDTFDGVIPADRVKSVLGSVRAQSAALAATIAKRVAAEPALRPLLWSFLGALGPSPRKDPLKRLPAEVAAAPLCPTIAHGLLSLRDLLESVERFGFLRRTTTPAQRQLGEAPYLLCDVDQAKTLKRAIDTSVLDATRDLEAELSVIARMEQPREPARLRESTVLTTRIVGPLIEGELGIPVEWSGPPRGGADLSRIRLLSDGIPLETRAICLSGLPLAGVMSSPRFKPNPRWDAVIGDVAWADGLRALQAATERLVQLGCTRLEAGELAGIACSLTCLALQTMAGRRFRGQPALELEGAPELDWALARARIWLTPEETRISLEAVASGWASSGTVLLVEHQLGHVASDHVILSARDPSTRAALAAIFGETALEDGRAQLTRDEAAFQRQRQAPPVEASRLAAVAFAKVEEPGRDPLEARGQVGAPSGYARAQPGIAVTIGLRGRRLCEHRFAHPLRGVGVLDCGALRINRDWDGISDPGELAALAALCDETIWRVVERVATRAERLGRDALDDEDRRLFLCDALGTLAMASDRPELKARLLAAPLFRSVEGRALEARALLAVAEAGEKVHVVSEALDEGVPRDGRLIVRAGTLERLALERLLGPALEDHEQAWREELEGQRRRRLSERAAPRLELDPVALCYFTVGSASGVAGLIAASRPPYGDAEDRPSVLRLHVDRRLVEVRAPTCHPAIEVWVNDDRLEPAPSFREVREDANLERVIEVARCQIPELVARAAERRCVSWRDEPGDATRLRLCRYVAERRAELLESAAASPLGPEARLLEAPLWLALSGELVSTRRLLAAAAEGRAGWVTAGGAEEGITLEDHLVLAVREPERIALATIGAIPDLGTRLARESARRRFLRREPASSVCLDAAGEDREPLARRRLSDLSTRGELAILPFPGGQPQLSLHLFLERRLVQTLKVDWIAEAVAAVESATLTFDDGLESVVADEAQASFMTSILAELSRLLDELAGRAAATPRESREDVARTLVEAAAALARCGELMVENGLGRHLLDAAILERVPAGLASLGELCALGAAARYLRPEAEAPAQPGEGLLVRASERLATSLRQLCPLRDASEEVAAALARERRIAAAERAATIRWTETVARAQVSRGDLSADLALAIPADRARLWLRHDRRPVAPLEGERFPGLTGFLDGPFQMDDALERVAPTREQLEDLGALYRERLEAVTELALAASPERGGAYLDLCAYVAAYLSGSLEQRASRRRSRSRWARTINRDAGALPDPVQRALTVKLLVDDSGRWHDLRWAASLGEDATFVWCSGPPAGGGREGVILLVDTGPGVRLLLERVVGGKAVLGHDLWRQRGGREPRRGEPARTKPARPSAGNPALMRALQSLLRGVAGPLLTQAEVGGIQVRKLAAQVLVQRQAARIVVNQEHPLWTRARSRLREGGESPAELLHLATAFCAALHELPEMDLRRANAIDLLVGLAEARLAELGVALAAAGNASAAE
jgi:hypothetical protein